MGILDKVVKLEKRIEKLAARPDTPATPLEIRNAILDDVEEHVQPAGGGRRVFPFDRLSIEVLVVPAERAGVAAVLDPDGGFLDAVRERLNQAGCERIGRLRLSLKMLRKARPDWKPGVFAVTYERTEAAANRPAGGHGAQSSGAAPSRVAERTPVDAQAGETRTAQLIVLDGEATRKTYPLNAARTNIGRLAEVSDRHERVARRNQVVFLETDSAANQTVSRAQAHITFDPPAEYRLYDDHSSYGTRIVRDGRLIDIPSGSPRGVKLRAGDEIYFGRARVQFQLK